MASHTVRAHERRSPQRPAEYIDKHLALFSRRADSVKFCQLHGIPVVSTDDPRVSAPVPEPAIGGRSLLDEMRRIVGIDALMKKLGRA